MDGIGALLTPSTPAEVNALVNVVQLAILVAILRWVRGDVDRRSNRREDDAADDAQKPS